MKIKKIFYMLVAVMIMFSFAACVEMQEGVPSDVSYVPIDEIKVEEEGEFPPMPELEEVPPISIIEEELEEEEIEEEEIEVDIIKEWEEELEELIGEEIIEEIGEIPGEKEIVILVQETDLVNLKPVAYDPDEDTLEFTYSSPLDESGQWQTTYGDMGEYTITITASDSELTTSKDALLIVNKREETPTIDMKTPEELEKEIDENTELEFRIKVTDLNQDPLEYLWKLDGEEVSVKDSYTYVADFWAAGSHTIKFDVSDGTDIVSVIWSVTVNNVDRPPVLKVIPDITIKETEMVIITPEATDADEDEITYTISEPVGDTGVWETTYDDAGIYTVKVTATDGELEDIQEIKLTVINVNRAPVIENIMQVE